MFDVQDGASTGYRRIEVLTGPGRRRRWSDQDKARAVAESLVPGASPSQIARQWQICPQQLFTWRRQARAGLLVLPAASDLAATMVPQPALVPTLADRPLPSPPPAPEFTAAAPAPIEIEIAGAIVRAPAGLTRDGTDDGAAGGARVGDPAVITIPSGARVLLATRPVDVRKGAHGLAALTAAMLGEDPFSGVVVVFRAKRADRVKILIWDASGLVLIWKQLQQGGRWPPVVDAALSR